MVGLREQWLTWRAFDEGQIARAPMGQRRHPLRRTLLILAFFLFFCKNGPHWFYRLSAVFAEVSPQEFLCETLTVRSEHDGFRIRT